MLCLHSQDLANVLMVNSILIVTSAHIDKKDCQHIAVNLLSYLKKKLAIRYYHGVPPTLFILFVYVRIVNLQLCEFP